MKGLTALVTALGLAAIIGANDAGAADRTARLNDPATTGPTETIERIAPREGRLEKTAVPLPARPLGLSDIEQNGIREAIRGQIRALAARDAKGAFAYLAPSTKSYFADAGTFLGTLMTQIQPLANASKYTFAHIDRLATDAVQDVVVAGPKGGEWLARFTLERQPDGSWGIKSCKVEPLVGKPI